MVNHVEPLKCFAEMLHIDSPNTTIVGVHHELGSIVVAVGGRGRD